MDKITIKADRREVRGKKVKLLRLDGKLPGVIYGKTTPPFPITLNLKEATLMLKSTSSSALVTIDVDGEEFTTLVRERQRDFIHGNYLHVDFLAVSLTEKVKTKVNIVIEGIAPALEAFEALIISGLKQVEVESLPQDLPEKFTVDLSSLELIGDGIYVRELDLPANVEILDDPNEMIVVVSEQIIVEEEIEEEDLLEGEYEEGEEPDETEAGKEDAEETEE